MKKQIEKQIALATTLTAAIAATSSAATVQITLSGNSISSTGGNNLVADFTGDGYDDLTFTNPSLSNSGAFIKINGASVNAFITSGAFYADAKFASSGVGVGSQAGRTPRDAKYLNFLTVTDPRINNNAPTQGYLEVNSISAGINANSVTLTRFVFDDASTTRPTLTAADIGNPFPNAVLVPEPTSLALLALGAGGLLLRRQRKAA